MQWFIVPNLDGPISGGTHYNRMLIGALRTARIQCEVRSLDRAESVLTEAVAGDSIWVDSLHLDELPRLARAARPGTRLGMIAHYLPSLVSLGEGLGPEHLTPAEAAALKTAAMFLVSSPFMRGILRRLTDAGRPILHVEPGRSLAVPSTLPEPPPVRAVMVANLVPGKGIEAFLRSLTAKIQGTDKLYLDVVGGTAHDPPYAERCRAAASDPRIRGCVLFLGELPHEVTGEDGREQFADFRFPDGILRNGIGRGACNRNSHLGPAGRSCCISGRPGFGRRITCDNR